MRTSFQQCACVRTQHGLYRKQRERERDGDGGQLTHVSGEGGLGGSRDEPKTRTEAMMGEKARRCACMPASGERAGERKRTSQRSPTCAPLPVLVCALCWSQSPFHPLARFGHIVTKVKIRNERTKDKRHARTRHTIPPSPLPGHMHTRAGAPFA